MSSEATDFLLIDSLCLLMSAGIYDVEKANKQRVMISAKIGVETNKGRNLHSIADIVSYEDIINKIKTLADQRHYDLLEEFAEIVTDKVFEDKQIKTIELRIEKPDIFDDVKNVGIQITRTNEN